ncbi:MAG: hypothetical protein POELPBGB_01626 [Bacteroidia bacterium]|nr:hypothetical protein [Bacteroidia bacterium]
MKPSTPSTKFLLSIFLLLPTIVFSQVTELSNTPFNVTDYLGWDASTGLEIPLDIKHMNTNNPQPIRFFTNATERVSILSGGNVGIATTTPAYKLDVTGDINIATTQMYRIAGAHVLSNTGTRNLFIGTNAGASVSNGTDNLFAGFDAGTAITSGNFNTFVGANTGIAQTTATGNSFIGANAGRSNTSGADNTFVGYEAGFTNTTGANNTYIGRESGFFSTGSSNVFVGEGSGFRSTGNDNVLLGNRAGITENASSTGSENTFVGSRAGDYGTNTVSGNGNTFLGYYSKSVNSNLSNASAIGHRAYVTASNAMVLGSINGQNGASNNVNIGIGTTSPAARLHVVNNAEEIGIHTATTFPGMSDIIKAEYNQTSTSGIDGIHIALTNSATTGSWNNMGLRSTVTASATENSQNSYAVYALVSGGSIDNFGVYGEAYSGNDQTGSENYGGKFYAHMGAAETPKTNYGVYGRAREAVTNYGGYFISNGGGTTNYGVYAESSGNSTTNYGIYAIAANATTNNYSGYFSGAMYCTSTLTQNSDINLKENILEISNPLDIINAINPVKYNFKISDYPNLNLASGEHYGFIAQELEGILPSLVSQSTHPAVYDTAGVEVYPPIEIKGINYIELIPFLTAAIKEQQLQIQDLNSRLTSCCGSGIQEFQVPGYTVTPSVVEGQSTINHQQLASVARDLPVLSQNQPNPFTEKTLIRFYIPKTTKDAAIKVFDNTGSVHRLFSITGEGPGTIEIEANTLTAGNYYYSLLIGSNVIDTKTMVITK